jgi:hypothetical protein
VADEVVANAMPNRNTKAIPNNSLWLLVILIELEVDAVIL